VAFYRFLDRQNEEEIVMKKIVMLAVLAGTASAAYAQNGVVRLTDNGASYDVGAGTSTGNIPVSELGAATATADFFISGTSSDNLYGNWWWYRVNGTSSREFSVRQATGNATRTLSGTNSVTYNITVNATDSVDLTFTLSGNGGTAAVLNYSATFHNNATFARDISMFNWVDYFLANADAGDRLVHAFGPGTGVNGDRVLNISDSGNAAYGLSHWGYGASAYGVGLYSGVGAQISDTSIDNFTDQNLGAPIAPATGDDIGGIYQWNFGTIAAGGTATASGAIVVWNTVPTPGAAALIGLGGLVATRRRRA